MTQKKSTGSSGAKKKTTNTTPRKTTAKRMNSASRTKKSAPAKQTRPMNNQFWSVILFAAGVLVLLLSVIPGAKAWLVLHNALLGLFGVGIFLVPVILGYTGILIAQEKSREASRRAIWGVLLTVMASALVQLFFGGELTEAETAGLLWYERIGETIKLLWENGLSLQGGGVFSGIVVIPLVGLLDSVGAKIITVMLTVVLILLLTNLSIVELLQLLFKPFVWFGKGIVALATRGIDGFAEEFPDEDDEEEDEAENEAELEDEPEEDFPRFTRGSRRRRAAAEAEQETAAEPDEAAEAQQPVKSRRSRKEDHRLEEISLMLDHKLFDQGAMENIDLDIPIYEETPAAEDEINQLLAEAEEARNAAAGSNQMTLEEEAAFRQMAEDAAQESALPTNRLPWLINGDAEEGMDESIYEEEPEIPYVAPPITLLKRADNSANDADKSAELREKGKQLVDTLASFGVSVRITGIRRGPSVTRYEIQPAAGVKIAKITALADDIGLNLGGTSVRISQVEGKPALGVEVPNNTKDTVTLREILETDEFRNSQSKLTFAVGKDIDGNVILGDISKMPHMIIAGTTGSGKSVCTNSIIMSILYHASPDEVRLVLVDPKVVEFQPYDGVPHLLIPVVTQPQKAAGALNWAVLEMERRYGLCAQYGVRDLRGYNAIAEKNPELKKLPQILIIIDEFADLMMSSGKEVEAAVIRIAQKARAAGIHLIIATQRPTVDVITGLIKSNVPSRIGMSVKSAQDSRIILDCSGAETLLGNGDLLFYPNGAREPKRVQGCFCSDSEVEAVTGFLKSNGSSEYDNEIIEAVEQNIPVSKGEKNGVEEDMSAVSSEELLIVKAAELAVDMNQLSTTALQRRLKLGYAKAARIMDELEQRGVIGPSEGAKPRKVLMSPQELTEWKLRLASKGGEIES